MKNLFTRNQTKKINCQEYLDLIQLILDDEANEEQKKQFETHSDKCNPCSEHFEVDRSAIMLIREKLQESVAVPDDLADKIRLQIKDLA